MSIRCAILAALLSVLIHLNTSGVETLVRPLVPGFTVRELPLKLSNINNLVFAPDGRLFALGYDGRVHVLHDTNGDGLEDHADVFWDQPTLHVPVGMLWTPEGIYISSNGKVSLLRDDDKDGKADHEEIVASVWIGPDHPSGGVDAIGLARDPEGNLYFGLGCADYSNPYRVKDGTSRYDLQSERGTIVKLLRSGGRHAASAEGARFETKREIVCT